MQDRQKWLSSILSSPSLPASVRQHFQQEQQSMQPDLQTSVALRDLANTAWAAGAPASVVNALNTATIEVMPVGQFANDTDFDATTNTIHMSQDTLNSILSDANQLSQQHIIDANTGAVLDPTALKNSAAFHDMAGIQALLGVHEVTHLEEYDSGQYDADLTQIRQTAQAYLDSGAQPSSAIGQQLVAEYLDKFEYEQYLGDEQYLYSMGQAPQESKWKTIDNNGQPLPREQAVANLQAALDQRGLSADMVTAIIGTQQQVDAINQVVAQADPSQVGQVGQVDQTGQVAPADQTAPLPGGDLPGGHFPGGHFPGGHFPGGHFPGGHFPGGHFPGGHFPGADVFSLDDGTQQGQDASQQGNVDQSDPKQDAATQATQQTADAQAAQLLPSAYTATTQQSPVQYDPAQQLSDLTAQTDALAQSVLQSN
jgi:hypothetical protein